MRKLTSLGSPLVALMAVVFVSGTLWAQLTPLEREQFSDQSIALTPREFYPGPLWGTQAPPPASRLLEGWGIRFEAPPGWTPSLVEFRPYYEPIPSLDHPHGVTNLQDDCQCDTADTPPLVVHFDTPVKRLGFVLTNGYDPGVSTLRFYDFANNMLGTIESQPAEEFVGVETSSEPGISRVVISAPGHSIAVQEIVLGYSALPLFTTYVGQVADGVAGGRNLHTSLVILNKSTSTAQTSVQFFDPAGAPLPLFLQGAGTTAMPAAEVVLSIAPFSAARLKTDRTGGNGTQAAAGYARIQSTAPVDVRGLYSSSEPGGSVAEAGIASSGGWTSALTDVENSSDTKSETALAMVNVEDHGVDLTMTVIDQDGAHVATESVLLGPHEQLAKFVSEIFRTVDLHDFNGTLWIAASSRVSGVAVRTRDGFPTAAVTLSAAEE